MAGGSAEHSLDTNSGSYASAGDLVHWYRWAYDQSTFNILVKDYAGTADLTDSFGFDTDDG